MKFQDISRTRTGIHIYVFQCLLLKGALISIVHIKDSECQVPTCILHQYLKQYSGQLTRLQVRNANHAMCGAVCNTCMTLVSRMLCLINSSMVFMCDEYGVCPYVSLCF